MFSRSCSTFRRVQLNVVGRSCTTQSSTKKIPIEESDPAPLFFDNAVQKLLKTLTRPDAAKVFRRRKEGQEIASPVYKFMTTEELEKEQRKVDALMEEKLQMPPVVKKRKPITTYLSKDPALQGFDTTKYVFTDITFGVSPADRLIVTREPDGTLRHAGWDERFRMNQIYDPLEGREMFPPKMFEQEHLADLMKREEYEFVLDRACLQYDPDDSEFHRVTQTVYEAVNNASNFHKLRSTRHYGPLAFHLVWTRNINNLLLENITNGFIEDAVLLIQLYNKVHPSSKSAEITHDGDDLKFIQNYAEVESSIRGKLIATLHAYKELAAARKQTEEGIHKAHGLK